MLRHGATPSNESHRYLGLSDEPLSEAGRAQCRRLGSSPKTGRVYVSRLARAQESARICFPRAELVVVDGLEEFDFGSFEGRSAAEMVCDRAYRAWVDGGCAGPCPGGDARPDYVARVGASFARLVEAAKARDERELTVVAHGGTIMAAFSAFADARREGMAGYDDYFCWQVGPAEGFAASVRLVDGVPRIEDVTHCRRLPRPWSGER